MLHSNYIQILLNLKDVSIINFSDSSVTIQLPRKPHLCPCCHHTTNSVHDYRLQKIRHLTYCTQPFSIFISSKCCYRCPFCNKRFIENISFGKYQRMTIFIKFILSQISFLKSASSIAKDKKASASYRFNKLSDKISTKTVYLPEIISIYEFKAMLLKKNFTQEK